MGIAKRRVSDLTVDELKSVIHDTIAEDIDAWRETFDIISDAKLFKQIRRAEEDWATGKKGAYVSWEDIKRV